MDVRSCEGQLSSAMKCDIVKGACEVLRRALPTISSDLLHFTFPTLPNTEVTVGGSFVR
jgi:hypothetical protein